MTIERYKIPALIAAGLHGALFFGMTETVARPIIVKSPPGAVWNPPPGPEEPPAVPPSDTEESDPGTASAGVKPLPRAPEVVRPLTRDEPFRVPVASTPVAIDRVKDLGGHRGLPEGNGDGPEGWRGSIPDVHKLDRVPRAVVQRAPAYPEAARRAGINGRVTVQFVVDQEGSVVRAEAVEWTDPSFVDAAVRAVLGWRFQPGTQLGRKVSFRMAVPIEFNAAR
ncbi:transport protein TonB [Lacunisphaera limnophila]|uniref:Transport protein TonB n=1 Tax=Lacunisphaera limnophila TaxID=1838286 RepID=A0A1D8AWT9_9BACT|nr:energy transducer TonB [Lacunisphaera limnophila]AOS45358.1 transport protein TonB [Lacunisphaera limnophila]